MQNASWEDITDRIKSEDFQNLSPDARDLIQKLLSPPGNRYGNPTNMTELLTHRFFTKGQSV